MPYTSIDFVGLFSGIFAVGSGLGALVLRFGPWGARPDGQTSMVILSISFLAFWMVSLMASNVTRILQEQADQIAALQRQLADR